MPVLVLSVDESTAGAMRRRASALKPFKELLTELYRCTEALSSGDALNPASRSARCTKPQIRPLLFPNTTDMYRPRFSTRNASEKALRSSAS